MAKPLTYDFDAPVDYRRALDTAKAALADESRHLLDDTNARSRPRLVRMKDEAGRLIDRLHVPNWMVRED